MSYRIKLIIFDLDGTLIDAYQAIIKSFNYTMQKLNYPLQADAVIRSAVGWGDANLLKPFIDTKDLRKALIIYRSHHKVALLRYVRLFPHVRRLLRYLKAKGYKLAIASNRPTRFSWIIIKHLKLKIYFDYVLCADKLSYGKPHPEILHKIMQRFSVVPDESLYVGDMAIDAKAAHRAGIKAVIVTTGSSTIKEIKKEKPYKIIRRIIEFLKILP